MKIKSVIIFDSVYCISGLNEIFFATANRNLPHVLDSDPALYVLYKPTKEFIEVGFFNSWNNGSCTDLYNCFILCSYNNRVLPYILVM